MSAATWTVAVAFATLAPQQLEPGKRLGLPGAAMPRWHAVDFRRRRPSSQTLDWVERVAGARVLAWRRMTGGVASVVHRLTIDHGGYRNVLVLRQYEHEFLAHAGSETAALVRTRQRHFAPFMTPGFQRPSR